MTRPRWSGRRIALAPAGRAKGGKSYNWMLDKMQHCGPAAFSLILPGKPPAYFFTRPVTKNKLLMVVGAGASIDFGLPRVDEVGQLINDHVQWQYPLAGTPASNLYRLIEDMVGQYWTTHVPKHLVRAPHYEDVLYAIFALAAAYPAGIYTSPLAAVIQATPFPDINLFGTQIKAVGKDELNGLGVAAVDAIVDVFRARCATAEKNRVTEFGRLETFVAALQNEFDIAVVTLNYDNVMYRAFPGIETGFDPATDRFDEKRILQRTEWACMLHLHGSVHFDMPFDPAMASGHDLHEIRWQPDINAAFAQNASGRSSQRTPEGADFPTSVVVAGYGKTMQMLRRPFRTYYSELDRLVCGCDAALFAGYGFGDAHLNAAFQSFRDSRRRPVVILDYATKGSMTLSAGESGSRLARVLAQTLHTNPRTMRWLGWNFPHVVDDLIDAREFEISGDLDTPLSVWYNGIMEACVHPDKVTAALS